MMRLQWMTMLSGVVLGAALWLPVIAQEHPDAISMGILTVEASASATEAEGMSAAIPDRIEASNVSLNLASDTAALTPYKDAQLDSFPLAAVNGVSLGDDIKTIYEIKGTPLSVKQDEILKSAKLYAFEDCQIGFADGAIQYVSVSVSAGQIEIDGHTMPMNLALLKSTLGKPYFEAEDGIVYKVRNNALKIYIEPATGQLTSVHFFPAAGQ
jgi:hypothetical protein